MNILLAEDYLSKPLDFSELEARMRAAAPREWLLLDLLLTQHATLGGTTELIYGLRPEHLGFAGSGLAGTLAMIEPTGPETYALADTRWAS
jgi:hypothetical protein